ncbi:hypothetical protein [Paraclostridium dentum]|uniref:DUF1700 domain-containing protein n=1 Tax=Paraclostridium bifermentans TaxID=1490 RepID=A0ABY8R4Z9_PARBF|nr:hypothetical protein [Paraclostridium dentum]WGX76525.1 hypothetical protein QJS64_05050 [Paraclostridium bifermentans]
MSNTIKVKDILNESYKDFTENSYIYNEIYKFYKEKELSIEDIELLIMDMELKAAKQTNLIDSLNKIYIALSVPTFTYFTVKISNIDTIKLIALIVVLILVYFCFMKPASKQIQINHQEKFIYLLTIKALNDIRIEIQ